MKASCVTVPYDQTGYYSKLVLDYLRGDAGLKPFFQHEPDLGGIKDAMAARKPFPQNRPLLLEVLKEQYSDIPVAPKLESNIRALEAGTTFTVTTAHQPNIFTGPLYFIYKILHAIKLAEELENEFPEHKFVPVYYMGSEDADLDELGHIFLSGDKLEWNTNQSGAIGRMNTSGIEPIINRLRGEFGHLPFAGEMLELCQNSYSPGRNIQQATLWLVNELFGELGLVVLIPDNSLLKSAFIPVIEKELFERFSHRLVHETAAAMEGRYKVQTEGREINLFYLSDDGSRDRIEFAGSEDAPVWQVVNRDLFFTADALRAELHAHPERFSPNVILRGVFQETILPNIAFIGGGGELAYWMELKKVFEAVKVPFPVLLLRNSFLLVAKKQEALQEKLQLKPAELFIASNKLLNAFALNHAEVNLETKKEQQVIYDLYKGLQEKASGIDSTLKPHVAALHAAGLKGLINLEKKFLRAEKRRHAAFESQLSALKNDLFPRGNLQERIDNFMPLYAKYGRDILASLYQFSQPFAEDFSILYLSE
jgi:bacillithiol biosynthesis cysteine-adding enzyme BshC